MTKHASQFPSAAPAEIEESAENKAELSDTASALDNLDAHLPQSTQRGPQAPRVLVGLVVDDRHPTLRGRIRVRWTDTNGETSERWLPALYAMPVRTQDRVLVQFAENWDEPIVTGVIDGFAMRPEHEKSAAATLEIKRDEIVRIDDSEGRPLLEVHSSEKGPVLKLLSEDVNLEVPGKFSVQAKSIQLDATLGEVRVTAHDDVLIKGENVRLNST